MGYDQPRPLGSGETGGTTALPIWIRYMKDVLKGVPEMPPARPEGVLVENIDPASGAPSPTGTPEYFLQAPPKDDVQLNILGLPET
jgi:penicillin-binding protein 1A